MPSLPLSHVALLQIYCTPALVCIVDNLFNRLNKRLKIFKSACTNFAYTSFCMFFHILLFFGYLLRCSPYWFMEKSGISPRRCLCEGD